VARLVQDMKRCDQSSFNGLKHLQVSVIHVEMIVSAFDCDMAYDLTIAVLVI